MNNLRPFAGDFAADQLRNSWQKMTVGTYEDWNHYGTKGMFSPFACSPWRMQGTIEKGSKFRPGIRCNSMSDAWRLFYGLSRIELSDASGTISGVPRWQASGATAVTLTRRVDPVLWLAWNHVDVDDGWGGVYQQFSRPPEALSGVKKIKKWMDVLPWSGEDHFMRDVYYDGVYQGSESPVRWWPNWYAEVVSGQPTGAVYMRVESGFSGRYYKNSSTWYHIQCYLGCKRYYADYDVQHKTFTKKKTACEVDFELYGCYFATKAGNLGLGTPELTDPQKRFDGVWS